MSISISTNVDNLLFIKVLKLFDKLIEKNKIYKNVNIHKNIANSFECPPGICTLSRAMKIATDKGFITRIKNGHYIRNENNLSTNAWNKIIDEVAQTFVKKNKGIDIKTDVFCCAILEILKTNSPIPVPARKFADITKTYGYTRGVIDKRLRLLQDMKIIEQRGVHSASMYSLYNIEMPTQKEILVLKTKTEELLDEKIKELTNQNNIFKAAFISIGQKLEKGEDIKQVLIDTGKLISEM